MFTKLTKTATIAALAAAIALPAPAMALGKNERKFLQGMLAAGAIAVIIDHNKRSNAATPDRDYGYHTPDRGRPGYTHPGYGRPDHGQHPPAYGSAAAQAFAEYSPASKRAIQTRLRAYGYYRGAIDGVWGPGTSGALQAYARDTGNSAALSSRDATVRLLNGLLA